MPVLIGTNVDSNKDLNFHPYIDVNPESRSPSQNVIPISRASSSELMNVHGCESSGSFMDEKDKFYGPLSSLSGYGTRKRDDDQGSNDSEKNSLGFSQRVRNSGSLPPLSPAITSHSGRTLSRSSLFSHSSRSSRSNRSYFRTSQGSMYSNIYSPGIPSIGNIDSFCGAGDGFGSGAPHFPADLTFVTDHGPMIPHVHASKMMFSHDSAIIGTYMNAQKYLYPNPNPPPQTTNKGSRGMVFQNPAPSGLPPRPNSLNYGKQPSSTNRGFGSNPDFGFGLSIWGESGGGFSDVENPRPPMVGESIPQGYKHGSGGRSDSEASTVLKLIVKA
jgi:hypothetical protein